MEKFLTEKAIEQYLIDETRTLTIPNGQKETVRAFNLTWTHYDSLIATNAFSAEELITLSYEWHQKEPQHAFRDCFINTVGYAFKQVHKKRFS